MYDQCPECGQNFRPEPGFYFGAAVVSYALTVTFSVIIAIAFHLISGNIFDHVLEFLITLVVALLLTMPLSFRYARIVWLHIAFRYRG